MEAISGAAASFESSWGEGSFVTPIAAWCSRLFVALHANTLNYGAGRLHASNMGLSIAMQFNP
jgi:hypothetical protein